MKRSLREAYWRATASLWSALCAALSPLSIFVRGGTQGAEATWRALSWACLGVAGVVLVSARGLGDGTGRGLPAAAASAAVALGTSIWLATPGRWTAVRRLARSATLALTAGTLWSLWLTREMTAVVAEVDSALGSRLSAILGADMAADIGLRATELGPTHFGQGVAIGFIVALLTGTRFLSGFGYPLRWTRRQHQRAVRRIPAG